MKTQVFDSSPFCIVELDGSINQCNPAIVAEPFEKALESKEGVIALNLEKTEHLDSAGVAMLIHLSKRAKERGKKFVSVNPNEKAQQLLQDTNLYRLIPVVKRLEDIDPKTLLP